MSSAVSQGYKHHYYDTKRRKFVPTSRILMNTKKKPRPLLAKINERRQKRREVLKDLDTMITKKVDKIDNSSDHQQNTLLKPLSIFPKNQGKKNYK